MVMSVYFKRPLDRSQPCPPVVARWRRGRRRAGADYIHSGPHVFRLSAPSFSRGLRASSYGERHHGVCATVGGSRDTGRRGSMRSHHREGNQRTVLDQRSSRVQCCGFNGGFRPLIARFYGEPRLTGIVQVSALTFVASALSCQHSTLLRRAMKFRDLAAVEIGANLLSAGGAIAMAVYGFDYWALVLRPVLAMCFIASGCWLRCS